MAASAYSAVIPTISVLRVQIVYTTATIRKKTPRMVNSFWLIFTSCTYLCAHVLATLQRYQFWVMEVQCWTFRTDTWQGVEVMTWRWARGGPLECSTEAPWVVDCYLLAVASGVVDVPQERDDGCTQEHRRNGRELVHDGEAIFNHVVGVTTWHTHDTKPVLDQEGSVEAQEKHPELDLAPGFVEHLAGELRPPEVEAGEHGEHDGTEHDVVEVCHNEVCVGDLEVQWWRCQDDTGQTTEQEGNHETERP